MTPGREYRLKLAEKLMDLGNLLLTGLILGVAAFQKIRPLFAIGGAILAVGVYVVAYILYTGGEDDG